MLLQGISAALASLGFALLFNIRGDKLVSAAMIGGFGGLAYYLSLDYYHSTVTALFIASIVISILSEIFARIQKCPVTTFLLCALIPLVPGGGMYYTMLEIVRNHIDGAISMGISTLIQAFSIVVGCMLISSFLRLLNQLKSKHNTRDDTK